MIARMLTMMAPTISCPMSLRLMAVRINTPRPPAPITAAMVIGGEEQRHAAAVAAAINPESYVSPTLTGGIDEADADGIPLRYSIPSVFGRVDGIELTIGEAQVGLFSNWLIFHDPFTFLVFWVYFTCAVASVNRAPFDLAEAESELVAGFHTEYSGLRWSFFFMAEYGSMFLVSGLAAILFFGG